MTEPSKGRGCRGPASQNCIASPKSSFVCLLSHLFSTSFVDVITRP